jgi:hypothetical protein
LSASEWYALICRGIDRRKLWWQIVWLKEFDLLEIIKLDGITGVIFLQKLMNLSVIKPSPAVENSFVELIES